VVSAPFLSFPKKAEVGGGVAKGRAGWQWRRARGRKTAPPGGAWGVQKGEVLELSIRGVSKSYKGHGLALDAFSLELGPGVLGLLGPNGAGKSTLLRILATLTRPSAGTVLWNGVNVATAPEALRSVLGYLPQDFGVYPHLSAVEFLAYLAALKGLGPQAARRRIDELLNALNLWDARSVPLGEFSGGMRQRVGIAQALLNDPELLIIDEPTVGLDPEERVRFRNLVAELAGKRIVLLSTHIVSDVEATAERIAILHRGRLVASGAPEALLLAVQGRVWEWLTPAAEAAAVPEHLLVTSTLRKPEGVQVRAVSDGPPVPSAKQVPPSLEDAYLQLATGGAATAGVG
jgi:ABC-2 type transport system ATP-binding protein